MSGENYDFTPWDSEDDIEKFLPLLAGRALLSGGSRMLSAGAKKLGLGGAKVGVKGAGAAAETATGAAKTAATSASEAVTSVAPKPTRLPKASDGTESVPLPKTPEAPEPAAAEPESAESENKNKTAQAGMQMASQMMAQGAQRKQAQEESAKNASRRGASISTGTPMDIAMRLLKISEDEIDEIERGIEGSPKDSRKTIPEGRKKIRSMGTGSTEEEREPSERPNARNRALSFEQQESQWDNLDVHPGSRGHEMNTIQDEKTRGHPPEFGTFTDSELS